MVREPAPQATVMPSGPAWRMVPGSGQPVGTSRAATGGKILSWEPSGRVVVVPGHGSKARMRRSRVEAGRDQSRRPSARESLPMCEEAAAFWGVRVAEPSRMEGRAARRATGARAARRSWSEPPVSSGVSWRDSWWMMSPESRPASICMTVMPERGLPERMAAWMGAAPRWSGRREAWRLTQPSLGRSRMCWGRI